MNELNRISKGHLVQKTAQFDDRIRNLLALAEDNSVESRTLLFSHICDLFLQKRPMETDNQKRMLVEIINELINDVDISIRSELCDILLDMDQPPEVLLKLISEDVIEVSGKLLEQALIGEEQLLYLIKYGSDQHRDFISRRFGLSPLLRRELDHMRKEQASAAQKINLTQLEEAQQTTSELNEDATANILEVLRTRKKTAPIPKLDISLIYPSNNSLNLEKTEPIEENQQSPTSYSLTSKIIPIIEESIQDAVVEDIDEQDTISPPPQEQNNIAPVAPEPMAMEWFWEIDRDGNIVYLSDNSQMVFSTTPSSMIGIDFLSLWVKEGVEMQNNHDIITLFEKRTAFRDQQFLLSLPNNEIKSYLLSAIATFDLETGRFTGFRGSAQVEEIEPRNPVLSNSQKATYATENPNTENLNTENLIPENTIIKSNINENDVHRPTFSDNISANSNETTQSQDNIEPFDAPLEDQDDIASELLHNLSHEFRTPLNAIIGFSQMIDNQMWGPVSDPYRKNTKDIIDAANKLKEAVNNILDGAKIEAGLIKPSPSSFSLKTIIQESMLSLAPVLESKEINISGINDNIDVILYNDKSCIILCLIKMITFATKDAPVGSDLHISVLVNSNAQVRIEISLINMNIDEQNAETLFEKLIHPSTFLNKNGENTAQSNTQINKDYSTKIASGFGLSVAQDIAKLIGGNLSTLSKNGKITHIVLTISTYPI